MIDSFRQQDTIVEVKNADIVLEGKLVVGDLHFSLKKGEFVYLIGKTGSGKSSILKTLYADLPPSSGSITVAGFQLNYLPRNDIPFLRRKLGIIFQDFELLDDRTVAENLYFVLKAVGWTDKKKMQEKAEEVLQYVRLPEVMQKMPFQLSGGEQQRVAIARALLNDPLLILADEPTGNLDPEVAFEILELFIEINRRGTAILMATHHHSFLKRFPARVLFCEKGKVRDMDRAKVWQRMRGKI